MKEISPEIVLEIINSLENMDVNNEQLEDNLVALGMDSIKFIQLVVALEESFECEIPDEKLVITEMDTVQKIIHVLRSINDNQCSN